MEILYRSRKINKNEYVEGSLYITDDGRHFILLKGTLWVTESEGSDMRSVSVAHEVYAGHLAMWTGRVDKNNTKIFMACHNLMNKWNGADKLVRGGYNSPDIGGEDRKEALGNPTMLAFDGFNVQSHSYWTPEDWDNSICYWGVIEVVGIHR